MSWAVARSHNFCSSHRGQRHALRHCLRIDRRCRNKRSRMRCCCKIRTLVDSVIDEHARCRQLRRSGRGRLPQSHGRDGRGRRGMPVDRPPRSRTAAAPASSSQRAAHLSSARAPFSWNNTRCGVSQSYSRSLTGRCVTKTLIDWQFRPLQGRLMTHLSLSVIRNYIAAGGDTSVHSAVVS